MFGKDHIDQADGATMFYAHDLLWLSQSTALQGERPHWMDQVWDASLPVVVRRARTRGGSIVPVGVRGTMRGQRAAFVVKSQDVIRKLTPCDVLGLLGGVSWQGAVWTAARSVSAQRWPFDWGIGGSCGYSLAIQRCVTSRESDLDLIVRLNHRTPRWQMRDWYEFTRSLSVYVDTQIDTGVAGFSLQEWMQSETVLLKTNDGPKIVNDPWEGQNA